MRLFYKLTNDIPNASRRQILLVDWESFFRDVVLQPEGREIVDEYVDLFFDFIFKIFDENNDGYISKKEYADIFEVYGLNIEYIDEAFESLDSFKDGRLSRYELKNAIETFFISEDENEKGNQIFGYLDSQIPNN